MAVTTKRAPQGAKPAASGEKRASPSGARAVDHAIEPTSTQWRLLRLLLWSTTVILVRHAERDAAGGSDPELNAAGLERAKLLGRMTQDAKLRAVYVTATKRSRQTGKPSAIAAGVGYSEYDALDAAALAARIRADALGATVLVVAHSNTVDDIGAALGAVSIGELADTSFDRMFVISRSWCRTQLLRTRYGAPTPP